jgi:hypothetical protein
MRIIGISVDPSPCLCGIHVEQNDRDHKTAVCHRRRVSVSTCCRNGLRCVDVQLVNVLTDAAAIARRLGLLDFDCVAESGTGVAAAIVSYVGNGIRSHYILGSSRPLTPGSVVAEAVKAAKCPAMTIVR